MCGILPPLKVSQKENPKDRDYAAAASFLENKSATLHTRVNVADSFKATMLLCLLSWPWLACNRYNSSSFQTGRNSKAHILQWPVRLCRRCPKRRLLPGSLTLLQTTNSRVGPKEKNITRGTITKGFAMHCNGTR